MNASRILILWKGLWINTNRHSLENMLRREITCHGTHSFPSLVDSAAWFLLRLHSSEYSCPDAQENCFHSNSWHCNLSNLSILPILLGVMWYLIMALTCGTVRWTWECVYWPFLGLCKVLSDIWYTRKFQSGLMLPLEDKCCYLHHTRAPNS